MAIVSELLAVLGLDPREFDKGLASVQKKLKRTARKLDSLGRDLTVGVTAPLAAVGGIAVKSFADFDKALNQSTAILKGAEENMGAIEQAARDVGKETVFSATQGAEAFFFLASAGFDAEESIAALPKVAAFAQAGMFDLATATDLVTDAQSAAGLKSDDLAENLENLTRVSDVLVGANTLANATVEQFSQALTTKAAASARQFGIEIEEVVAVLAVFADQGIKGQEAGTALSILIRNLTTQAEKNAEAFEALGIEVFDANGNFTSFADIVEDLERELGGLSDEQKKATLAQLDFADKAQASIFAVLGLSKEIRNYLDELNALGGITDEVSNKQLRSFTNQLKLLQGRVQDVFISIGQELVPVIEELIPLVDKVGGFLERLLKRFSSLNPETKRVVIAIAGVITVLGPLAAGLAIAIKTLGALGALLTPGGLVLAGFGLLATAMALTKTEAEKADEELQEILKSVREFTKESQALGNARLDAAIATLREESVELEKKIRAAEEILKRFGDTASAINLATLEDQLAGVRKQLSGLVEERDRLFVEQSQGPVQGPELPPGFGGGRPGGQEAEAPSGKGFLAALFEGSAAGLQKVVAGLSELHTQQDKAILFFEEMKAASLSFSEQANLAWAQWAGQANDILGQLKLAALDFVTSFSQGFGDAVARMIVDGESFKEVMKEVWKSILKQAIAAITKLVVEWLISLIVRRAASAVAHAAAVGQLASRIYLEAFLASVQAGGLIGLIAAPGVAKGAVATALGGSAGAHGSGVAAGTAQAAEGGFITRTGMALLHQGEIVATPDEAKAMMSGGVGEQTINVFVGSRKLATTVVRGLPEVVNARIGPQ